MEEAADKHALRLLREVREHVSALTAGRLLTVALVDVSVRSDARVLADACERLRSGRHQWSALLVDAGSCEHADCLDAAAGLVTEAWASGALDEGRTRALLSANAEGALDQRLAGSYYTPGDVTAYMTATTIAATLLDGLVVAGVEELVTAGDDLAARLERHVASTCDGQVLARLDRALHDLSVLDPTCGSGAFLLAAARLLDRLALAVARRRTELAGRGASVDPAPRRWRLFGVDASPVAVEACRVLLALHERRVGVVGDGGIDALDARAIADLAMRIRIGDTVVDDLCGWSAAAGVPGGFDVVVGNPPYVRAGAPGEGAPLATATCGNLYAFVSERALDLVRPGGRIALIVPVSAVCADAFEPLREQWRRAVDQAWVSSYDAIPSTLFPGTVQRLSIMVGRRRADGAAATRSARWYTTSYRKWQAHERGELFERLCYTELPPHTLNGSLAKVGTALERDLLERLHAHAPAGELLTRTPHPGNRFFYKRRWSYFLLFTDFVPAIYDAAGNLREPSELKEVGVVGGVDSRVLLAAYASSLFYWYFTTYSDNRNVNIRELAAFPFDVPGPAVARELCVLADELMDALRAASELRTCTYRSIGTIRNTYFRQAATKPVLDRIDAVLARHYGLSGEQLRFLTSFEAAFRTPGAASGAAGATPQHVSASAEPVLSGAAGR